VAALLAALLGENHLQAADVLAAVVRSEVVPASDLVRALRSAGVRGVPVFAGAAGGGSALELTLHVRLRRKRRLRPVELP
jgi:hypothetical protein